MADLILASVAANKALKNEEGFDGENNSPAAFGIIVGVLIMALAGYLSWQCNTKAGTNSLLKLIYAVIAALFGFTYLWYYAIWHMAMTGGLYCYDWESHMKS